MTDDAQLFVALNTLPGLRGAALRGALDRWGSPAGILRAPEKALCGVKGIGPRLAAAIRTLDPAAAWRREESRARAAGCRIVTIRDDAYPERLRTICDPPAVLFVRGELTPGDGAALAIVGSRAATAYGRATALRLACELADRGVTIVSGLARGIDSAAHRGALEGGGRTVAVLGSGIGVLYPPENRDLAGKIAAAGAVISEFPVDLPPDRWQFPLRNRAISGLCLGVVVVEAAARSGALITADQALEQGREVFAVPGNVSSPASAGTNRLLKQGARLVEGVEDILEELPGLARPAAPAATDGAAAGITLTGDESAILSRLGDQPLPADEIVRLSPAPPAKTLSILTTLELRGLVRQMPGRLFVRR